MIISEQDKLVMDNYDLVDHLISKYYPNYNDNDDVFSCAYLGLVQASRNYKTSYKQPFRAYARRYIFTEVNKYLKNENTYADHMVNIDDYDFLYDIDYDDMLYHTPLVDTMKDVLDSLTNLECTVITLRFYKDMTLKNIGKHLNKYPESISQIEARALRHLRYPSRAKRLRDFLYY